MKNALYFIWKALFVLEILTFLSWSFGHIEKQFDQNDEVNFKIHDVTTSLTKNCNRHCPISHELKTNKQCDLEN